MRDADDVIANVRRGMLPAHIYNDAEVFEAEKERVFSRTWTFVAHESEIPNTGDYVVRRVLEEFGELRRGLPGVSEKMLIQHLREMEADGIIHREVFHQVPPRVEYSVTPEGVELDLALAPLGEWGKKHQERTEKAKAEAAEEAPLG